MYPPGGPGSLAASVRREPLPDTPPVPSTRPEPMGHHEKMRLRSAAFQATRLYPGPVGDLISRELLSWEDFGYRLGAGRPVMELVDHIMKAANTPVTDR